MEKLARKKSIDMTTGSLLGKIVAFVLPLIATNLLQTAYNAADMMIVSMSGESNAMGAVGMTGAFINLVLNIFMGFAVGANIVIARHIGARENDEAGRATHTSLLLGLILGVVSGAIGIAVARPVLIMLGAKETLLDLGVIYCIIYFAGAPFTALTNYVVAIFRAKGDTKTPLYVLTLSGFINVCLNLLFVLVFGMSVDGVASATVISNAFSSITLLLVLRRDEGPCRFSFRKLRISRRALSGILRIGLPSGIQSAMFSISNTLIMSSILRVNDMLAPSSPYAPVVDGNAAAANLESFVYTASNSIYQATIAFTGQNVGARRYDRVVRILIICSVLSMSITTVGGLLVFLLNKPLLSLYGIAAGEGIPGIAYDIALTRMKIVVMPYAFLSIMEVSSGVLRGLGRSTTSMLITMIGTCALRVVWIFTVFESFLTIESIYISYPVSWIITGLVSIVVTLFVIRKEKARMRRELDVNTVMQTA